MFKQTAFLMGKRATGKGRRKIYLAYIYRKSKTN